MTERDPLLRRLERNALAFALAAMLVALAARGGRPDVAVGVAGGGALIWLNYWALKSSLDRFLAAIGAPEGRPAAPAERAQESDAVHTPAEVEMRAAPRIHKRKLAFALATFAGRYALLAFMAYVMIARLRLHPIGLIVGASSIVVAAGIEALRHVGSGRSYPGRS